MASGNFEKVKKYYSEWKTWSKKQVADAVGKWITAEEYEEITGEEYVAPEKVLTEAEEIAIDMALNVEYAVCLLEANMGL